MAIVLSNSEVKVNKKDQELAIRVNKVDSLCVHSNLIKSVASKVIVVLDFSGSMESNYKYGNVQDVVEKILPIGIGISASQSVDLYTFDSPGRGYKGYRFVKTLDASNYGNAVNNYVLDGEDFGGTDYSPVLRHIYEKEQNPLEAKLIIFITDGNNYHGSNSEFLEIVQESSGNPFFYHFIGIGNNSDEDLLVATEMGGKHTNNADLQIVQDINNLSEDVLYEKTLKGFAYFLDEARIKGII